MQHVEVVRPAAVAQGIPVRADFLEHEAGRRALVGEDEGVGEGREGGFRQPFLGHVVGEDFRPSRAFGHLDVLFPRDGAAVVAVLPAAVGGQVRAAEVVVGLREVARGEVFVERLAGSSD